MKEEAPTCPRCKVTMGYRARIAGEQGEGDRPCGLAMPEVREAEGGDGMSKEYTTIRITKESNEELKSMMKERETVGDVIERMLKRRRKKA